MKAVQRVVKRTCETKEKNTGFGKNEMYHNTFVTFPINNGSYMPTQGTADTQRVGDQLYTIGWKFKMLIGQKADRPNVTFKYYVLKVPKGSTYSYNNWFKNTSNNVLLDDVNTDFVKILTTGVWKPHDGSMDNATDEYVYTRKLWLPYKKLYKFGPADAAQSHNDDDLWFVCAAFDAYGTLLTDNIAYIDLQTNFYFKDP